MHDGIQEKKLLPVSAGTTEQLEGAAKRIDGARPEDRCLEVEGVGEELGEDHARNV